MTAEIALMNKSAIALASDSAITVHAGHSNGKVFNTANKLFTLSKYHPVGVMFYSSTEFGGVPWEIIVKQFRRHLCEKSFKNLKDYGVEFTKFLTNNESLFPSERQAHVIRKLLAREIYQQIGDIDVTDPVVLADKVKTILEKKLEEIKNKDFCEGFTSEDIDAAKETYADVYEELSEHFGVDATLVRECSSLVLTKEDYISQYSGLVIAGYGEDEIFPSLQEFHFDTIVNSKPRRVCGEVHSISHECDAAVLPFAQKEMVETILEGVNPSYNSLFLRESLTMWPAIIGQVIEMVPNLSEAEKLQLSHDARKPFTEAFRVFLQIMQDVRQKHHRIPILDAVAMMPIGELANVAETLVNMTQIKHRLTLETETVGGPIDVAVISKGDGFVWINRKHYFKQEMNLNFANSYFYDMVGKKEG